MCCLLITKQTTGCYPEMQGPEAVSVPLSWAVAHAEMRPFGCHGKADAGTALRRCCCLAAGQRHQSLHWVDRL